MSVTWLSCKSFSCISLPFHIRSVQVELWSRSASLPSRAFAENPDALLFESCRPGFTEVWNLKEGFRINGTYACTFNQAHTHQVSSIYSPKSQKMGSAELSFELQHLPDACKDQEASHLQDMTFEHSSGSAHDMIEIARCKEGSWRQFSPSFRTLERPCGSSNERSQSSATSEFDSSPCVKWFKFVRNLAVNIAIKLHSGNSRSGLCYRRKIISLSI
jgi:hypothetical protein